MAFPSTPTVCEPYEVVLPLEVTTPLRFALVVTVAALPVMLVSSGEDVLMADETPPLPRGGRVRAGRVGALVNTCVPAQVLLGVVPKASEMASVTRESGYEKVSGVSYVPKSETCDLVMERLPSVVMLATEEVAT